MIVAGLVTVVFHRFKQPVVLGYILAGVIIGPHTPPFPLIHDHETIQTLAELGVVFLMFSLGLEFSFRKLLKVGITAFIAATLEILLMFFVGYEVGQWFGWKQMDSIFLGAMLSISSTTIIVKALQELGKSKEAFADIIFGILIVEDILAIVMIALLSGIAMSGTLGANDILFTVGRLTIFLVTAIVLGLIVVPQLIKYVAGFKSEEMLLVTVLGLCFGVSLLAVKLGYSVALGAFVIGAVIAESREIARVENLLRPLRDMFSAVFFVAIGLLIQPRMLAEHAWAVLVITLAVVLGKIATCALGTFVAGHSTRTSLKVGMGLAQIGEFSFIIAALGLNLKVTSDFLYPIAVTVSAITTLLTPYLITSSDNLVQLFSRYAPRPMVGSLRVYTSWVGRLGKNQSSFGSRMLRKWILQLCLNTALVAAIFIFAAYLAQSSPPWLPRILSGERSEVLYWLFAAVASLPFFIANYRKLEAIGMLLSDVRISRNIPQQRRFIIQTVISRIIALTGTAALSLLALLPTMAILPPLEVLLVLFLILGIIVSILWRTFVKVYARGQTALRDALAEGASHAEELQRKLPLAAILEQARLERVQLNDSSQVIGKLLREVQLRTRTGASIVGIQRRAQSIVNPGPDEELLVGDELLILGAEEQLQAAARLLQEPAQG